MSRRLLYHYSEALDMQSMTSQPIDENAPSGCRREFCDGIAVGSVSVKRVRRDQHGQTSFTILRHEGDAVGTLRKVFDGDDDNGRVVITGQASRALLDAPYKSESECFERALSHHGLEPDLLLSLGGENFILYTMKDGRVKNIISPSQCAAGTGEFLVQQFNRMGLSLKEGIEASYRGAPVDLATRCAVFCKSDITHKLNKGEHSKSDIAKTLIDHLVCKVTALIDASQWPASAMVISGGLVLNKAFIESLRIRLPGTRLTILRESCCLEALGASLFAADMSASSAPLHGTAMIKASQPNASHLKPLKEAEALLDYRVTYDKGGGARPGGIYILGVDAGSTTTKAILFDVADGSIGASCYLRTHGNPVLATKKCILELMQQVDGTPIQVIQAAVTGSGREIVSVYLDNCLSFNEIMAHARAASEEVDGLDTLFEIGGQDSKYTSFSRGVPVDYAMNEGCSAGTGSFLEEVVSQGMNVPVDEISGRAERSDSPLSFGERCSAFINTDLKTACQHGARQEDIIAGLTYSIARNYVSRIVGPRAIGRTLVFQGGVALNRSVALAIAAITRRKVVVPASPELMGCIGTCLLAQDQLRSGQVGREEYNLKELSAQRVDARGTFKCDACDNRCDIQKLAVKGKIHPFGGLCSKYELSRHGGSHPGDGKDVFSVRHSMMFQDFGPRPVTLPRGRVGLPMALAAYEFYPFYAKLINELGYDVVTSRFSRAGLAKSRGPICYPCEIAHGAVADLIEQGVDFIFLPYLIEGPKDAGHPYCYTCTTSGAVPGMIKDTFRDMSSRVLSPHIGLSSDLKDMTRAEICSMGRKLGVKGSEAEKAYLRASDHYDEFRKTYLSIGRAELNGINGPTVIIAGRPYVTCSPEVNLSIPRKIASRGFHVLPVDLLPPTNGKCHPRNVWHFTQQMMNAVYHAKRNPDIHLCFISCFSCLPDAAIYHLIREELAGRPYCYLEIDSHSARLGCDTRLDAFLDIVENGRRRLGKNARGTTNAGEARAETESKVPLARFSDDHDCVIDSDGKRVEFDDPRVTHVYPFPLNPYASRILRNVYDKRGWNVRIINDVNRESFRRASDLCSGRECLVFAAMAGSTCADVAEQERGDKISIYYNYDQVGPCLDAAAPIIWETFARRLDARNAVFMAFPTKYNRYLGEGDGFAREFLYALHLGDLFGEAEGALACVARDASGALEVFREETGRVMEVAPRGFRAITAALKRWANNVARLPVSRPLRCVPKVLMLGGPNPLFFHRPVTDFFVGQGIIAKIFDMWEFIAFTESETVMRHCIKRGVMTPEEQFGILPLVRSLVSRKNTALEILTVLKSRALLAGTDWIAKTLRNIASESGLLYDVHVPYREIAQAGHRYVSYDAWCGGTTITIGKYLTSLRAGVFDGYVSISAFNCQPVVNAQTVIRGLANGNDVPYVALDVEGPWLSVNHRRLLETVAVQARRFCEQRG